MKRAHGHLAFGAAAAVLGLLTIGESLRLKDTDKVNMTVADWVTREAQHGHDTPAEAHAAKWTDLLPPAPDSLPEARLAYAVALSRIDYDGALAAYKAITRSGREDLRRIALYDLGNLNLRHALQAGIADDAQSLPLTELAKQSYRDLLRRDPNDWDARYNLERALRLAPEEDEDIADTGPPDPREHERSTIADPRMDLP
jgi:mxaK protein